MTPQVALWSIGKAFALQDGRRLEVLRDVSFAVEAEEFCCLVGPSGCGKSTILNIVAGLTAPDRGDVLARGARFDARRARIGYVFQKPRLLNWRTVGQNVRFVLRAASERHNRSGRAGRRTPPPRRGRQIGRAHV